MALATESRLAMRTTFSRLESVLKTCTKWLNVAMVPATALPVVLIAVPTAAIVLACCAMAGCACFTALVIAADDCEACA